MTGSQAVPEDLAGKARSARLAARRLATLPTEAKDRALAAVAQALRDGAPGILEANAEDVADARERVASGEMAPALLQRLGLDAAKLEGMAEGVLAVAKLPDPSGRVLSRTLLDDGLELRKVSCPLGVLAIVFEARPDAVTQISALALKSGNAVILKGGREAARTTAALVAAIRGALLEVPEIPGETVQSVTGREDVDGLLAMEGEIDLVIPRGGNDLVRYVQGHTRIPVLGHAEGICHVYVDAAADPAMAIGIVLDGKLQYPAACNATETVLVHRDAVPGLLGQLLARLVEAGVEVHGCPEAVAAAAGLPVVPATEADFRTEWGRPALSVKVVGSLDEAIDHVSRFGSRHTETIVTADAGAARRFLDEVDAAGVFHNASTRFADGFRYGLGAEVGVSTSKLHARGPVGLEGLVTYRWQLRGSGQVVATYAGSAARRFRHERLPVDPGPGPGPSRS